MTPSLYTVSDEDCKKVITDFLDMGFVENIVAMFRKDPMYYAWTGDLLQDGRFNVRLGMTLLFEELKTIQPEHLNLAIPSLSALLSTTEPLLRGEAISLLGIIGGKEALCLVNMYKEDPDPQVREMVAMVLEEQQ
jgi:hypothetical protein